MQQHVRADDVEGVVVEPDCGRPETAGEAAGLGPFAWRTDAGGAFAEGELTGEVGAVVDGVACR